MKSVIFVLFICFITYCAAIEGNIRDSVHEHQIHTNQYAVELAPGADPHKVAESHGFMNMGPVGTLENVYLFHKIENKKRGVNINEEEEELPHISTSPHVSWFEQQVGKMRFKRAFTTPSDPAYPNQWHLKNSNGVDINVLPAWQMGYTGHGVTIGVVDDGLQRTHPDIVNFNAQGSYDFNQNDADPTPHAGDDHGTSAGGVAGAARNNGVCGVGAAFEAGLSGIRLIADFTTDAQEAAGLSYRKDINDIYTNSWGPNDDGRRLEGPGSLTLRAMEDAVTTGRKGKGSIYVWAGGNGKSAGDNCNYDGYANHRFTIAIGATDYLGKQSYYSEPCAALIASAPSSGSARSITTTDLLGGAGTSSTDCTGTFGGTSAAAPLVAGVVALMLHANPNLGWRDVQNIFVNTSKKTDEGDAGWQVNGGGYHHNHKYGYGIVDAGAAVAAARFYINLPAQKVADSGVQTPNLAIPDGRAVEHSITIDDNIVVESVEVMFNANHGSRGDLAITLTSPHGTYSILQELHNDHNSGINWRYVTVTSWGEKSKGKWVLRVEDKRTGSSGFWNSWQLKIYGH